MFLWRTDLATLTLLAIGQVLLSADAFMHNVEKYLHVKMLPALYIFCINSSAFQPFSLKQTI